MLAGVWDLEAARGASEWMVTLKMEKDRHRERAPAEGGVGSSRVFKTSEVS